MSRCFRLGLIIAALIVIADQATKWLIVARVMDPPRVIEVLPFFNIVMVWNRGVSFGAFNDGSEAMSWVLAGFALAIAAGLVVWLWRAKDRLTAIAVGLIIGGAIGNVIDRVRIGAVADFLDFHIGNYHWPAFNLADSAITIGVGLILLEALLGERRSA
jgi:signal peptidase II